MEMSRLKQSALLIRITICLFVAVVPALAESGPCSLQKSIPGISYYEIFRNTYLQKDLPSRLGISQTENVWIKIVLFQTAYARRSQNLVRPGERTDRFMRLNEVAL